MNNGRGCAGEQRRAALARPLCGEGAARSRSTTSQIAFMGQIERHESSGRPPQTRAGEQSVPPSIAPNKAKSRICGPVLSITLILERGDDSGNGMGVEGRVPNDDGVNVCLTSYAAAHGINASYRWTPDRLAVSEHTVSLQSPALRVTYYRCCFLHRLKTLVS